MSPLKISLSSNKIVEYGAHFFSALLSPMLMPTYGVFLVLWCSFLNANPVGDRVAALMVVFGITCILPIVFIALLHNFKVIRDKRLDDRAERSIPYVFAILCYVAAYFYLNHIHAPQWFSAFMAGGALACAVSFVVNLKWKISAHMAGMAGIVTLLFELHSPTNRLEAFDLSWILWLSILLAGVLGSSRMVLGRHTLGQVLAGAVNGVVCVKLAMMILG